MTGQLITDSTPGDLLIVALVTGASSTFASVSGNPLLSRFNAGLSLLFLGGAVKKFIQN
jgi:hypothetical protein